MQDLDKAFALFSSLRKNNDLMPDEVLFNCLIDACVRFRDIQKALSVFEEMQI
jgi:pentatricopeptide repeat domain-containing protein 1